MPSTYTANSGIQLPANGEQSGTWGETVNDNMDIIDRLTNGVGAISLSGTTHTLTITDGTLSEGQYNVLVLGGSPSGTNTITITPNDGQHVYIVKNSSGQSAIFTQGSGGDITLLNGETKVIYSDGVGAGSAVVDITNDFAMGNVTITGGAISGATLSTSSFTLGGIAITATGTEINILDGVTATAAEINILDGVTATAAELNYNDITTLGTVQASKTVTADASGDVLFPDNAKAIFGAGSDLQIYHDATDSYVKDNGTGNLLLQGTNLNLQSTTAADYIRCTSSAQVELYHNAAQKLATTATGIQITGTALATTDTDASNTGTVTLDFAANQNFVLTLTGDVTLDNPTTEQVGQSGFIVFIQDGTGSRTVSLGTDYETVAGAGLALSSAASATDVVPYIVAASGRILLGTPQLAFA
jgi:hypothetical protein